MSESFFLFNNATNKKNFLDKKKYKLLTALYLVQ
jgi:hypothetical protein